MTKLDKSLNRSLSSGSGQFLSNKLDQDRIPNVGLRSEADSSGSSV
jgi:hypothetical protein